VSALAGFALVVLVFTGVFLLFSAYLDNDPALRQDEEAWLREMAEDLERMAADYRLQADRLEDER